MPIPTRCARVWTLPDCPATIAENAPPGYGDGTVAIVWGGTADGLPDVGWLDALEARLGLTGAAAGTLALRNIPSFLWTAFYDPTGQVTPASPRVQVWPPE